jgi:hypothetical protein
MISFFVEIVADTRQGEVVSPSRIIFVKNVKSRGKNRNPPTPPFTKRGVGGIKEK